LPNGLLDGLAFDVSNDYGLVVEDLLSGAREALNESKVFPSASIYKLGVAWSVLRRADAQQLNLDQQLTIEDEDAVEVEPDGGVAPGDAPTIREALAAMLSVSSNAAAHALLRLVGRAEVNQEMDRIGLTQTRVPENQSEHDLQSDATAVTSASDVAHLLRLIASSPLLNTGSRNELSQWLASPDPPDALRDTLPDGVSILDKTGNLDDASNVGALLHSARGTVILVVLDQGVDPGDARAVIAHLGQAAYQAFLQSD
jgi:beta-lactamase class A